MAAGIISIIKDTFTEWRKDDAVSESASIAFYAILSLPGLLALIVYLAGLFFGTQAAEGEISAQISQVAGKNVAMFVESLIKGSSQNKQSGIGLILGIVSIVLSATAVFLQLQKVLNKIWRVKPSSKRSGILILIFQRLISFGLIIFMSVLLMAFMIVASAVTLLQSKISEWLPGIGIYVFYGISFLVAFLFLSIFFGMIYKFLPDAKVKWKTVRMGAMITAILFIAGIFGLELYFGMANPTSAYGAAGSAILILLWAYYSGLIFLFGAEFTKVYANKHSIGIQPSKYAEKIS